MAPAVETFEQMAGVRRAEVDEALARYLEFGPGCPDRLAEAMRYSLLAPGKRLRPLLVLISCEVCGGPRARAMPAACAVEMVHTYSLIHDDLPAMDDDDLRRGRPTNHKVFGEGLAILAGDALLTRALEIVARDTQPPAVAAACCAALGEAAGAAALVGGQADDLDEGQRALAEARYNRHNPPSGDPVALAQLESIHRRKTGAMLNVCLRLGGLVAGATQEQLQTLRDYGERIGLAFQIADDLLDVRGNQDILGKRVQKDSDRGKLTFPTVLGVEASLTRAQTLISEACNLVAGWGIEAEPLRVLARFIVERDR